MPIRKITYWIWLLTNWWWKWGGGWNFSSKRDRWGWRRDSSNSRKGNASFPLRNHRSFQEARGFSHLRSLSRTCLGTSPAKSSRSISRFVAFGTRLAAVRHLNWLFLSKRCCFWSNSRTIGSLSLSRQGYPSTNQSSKHNMITRSIQISIVGDGWG